MHSFARGAGNPDVELLQEEEAEAEKARTGPTMSNGWPVGI